MSKHSFLKGVLVGAGVVITLLVLLFLAMPYLYLQTENSNFAKLREKSQLDCQSMPLHCLIQDGDREGVATYIGNGGDLELRDNWGRTALFWAISQGRDEFVDMLMAAKADADTRDENGTTVLYQTLAWSKFDIADKLLAGGADIDAMSGDRHPETPLHFCVMKDRPQCVSFLLDRGADRYLRDSFGYNVFDRVRMHEHIGREVAGLLELAEQDRDSAM